MVTPAFDWGQMQEPEQQEARPTSQQKETSFSWGEMPTTQTYQGEPDPSASESIIGWLARNVTSGISRLSESVLGGYGDIEQLARKGLAKNPGAAGVLGKAIYDLVGKENWENVISGKSGGQFLPTSKELREGTEKLTGEYTKPKTENERRYQNLLSDIGSMRTGGRRATGIRTLYTKAGIPVAANAAKEAVDGLGYNEKTGEWAKLATWLGLSLAEGINANTFAANLMNEGRNGFGPNVVASTPRYQSVINAVDRNMLHGDPRSALAREQIAGIYDDIGRGNLTIRDLMNRYDAINAAKRNRGLFDLNRADRKAAIHNINQVRDAVRSEIETLGRVNPEALRSWQNGVNAFSVIHRSNTVSNFVMGQLKKIHNAAFATAIFGSAAFKAPITTSLATPALLGANKGSQILFRIWSDPNLAHYYWHALSAASRENGAAFTKSYNALEKAYEKKYGRYESAQ